MNILFILLQYEQNVADYTMKRNGRENCKSQGIAVAISEHFARGGEGAVELAQAVIDAAEKDGAKILVDGLATCQVRMNVSGSGIHWVGVKHDQFLHFSILGPRSHGRALYRVDLSRS